MTGPQKKELQRLHYRYQTVGLTQSELDRRSHLEVIQTTELSSLAEQLAKRLARKATKGETYGSR